MKKEGRGNAGLMDNEENQKQVSLVIHSPWKSLRDSHISTAPAVSLIYPTKTKPRNTQCKPWKSGNRQARFPLSHRTGSLRRKEEAWVSVYHDSSNPEHPIPKGGLAADRVAPAVRLIIRLENASAADASAPCPWRSWAVVPPG
jgi:hypothetical protein